MKMKPNENRIFCIIVGCGDGHATSIGMKQHYREAHNYDTKKSGGDKITLSLRTAIPKGPEGPEGPEGPHLPGLRRPA